MSTTPALTRTQIHALLERHGLSPSRALGQNFLADAGTIARIVRLAGIGPGDHAVEIGPGLGSLTLGLCAAGARVTAIEVDRYLLPALREVVAGPEAAGQLRIVHADARAVDWDEVLGDGPATVVANLPYNIATPVVLEVLDRAPSVESVLVMVQREVGERLAAEPGTKAYGIPSVRAQYWAAASVVGRVPATVFHPVPKVESVLVRLDRRPEVPEVDRDRLWELVRTAFGQRRKMLRRSLGATVSPDQFAAAGIDPSRRPESLSVSDWVALAR